MTTDELESADTVAAGRTEGDVDGLFDVLSHSRRRFVVAYLDQRSAPTAVADLAADLARWERDRPEPRGSDDGVAPRYLALYHVHLPRMAEAGMVEYDRESETLTLADEYDGIAEKVALPSVD